MTYDEIKEKLDELTAAMKAKGLELGRVKFEVWGDIPDCLWLFSKDLTPHGCEYFHSPGAFDAAAQFIADLGV